MTTKCAFYTISDPLYVNLAPIMFKSVREHYPEAELYLFMIGTGKVTILDDNVHVIYISDIVEARDLEQRLCYYLGVELATSFRPHCFQSLFEMGFDRVTYLDPDLYIFRRMTEADDLLDAGVNGIVTAHALQSISEKNGGITGGDIIFLQVGIFNLGYLALNHTAETMKMLEWWHLKLKWTCVVDTKVGLFVDQRWLEFLPVYFDGFHILRLPTYNLAPWNAEHHKVLEVDGTFCLDTPDNPVAFIHYSGVKRSTQHFSDMEPAYRFYQKKLDALVEKQYGFHPYRLRMKLNGVSWNKNRMPWDQNGMPWDKVTTFLYKDFVKITDDKSSSPLSNEKLYDFITGIDPEVGLPRYLRKVFEMFPQFATAIFFTGNTITFDNLLRELETPTSPYSGSAFPETIQYLKKRHASPRTLHSVETASGQVAVAQPRMPIRIARRARPILMRSHIARNTYAGLKKVAMRLFRLHDRTALERVEFAMRQQQEVIYQQEQLMHQQGVVTKMLLKNARGADIVK